ncbi:MAG: DUF309 domain-containing protein [Chloroflexaceae bacterium]
MQHTTDPIARAVSHFNAEEYREALLAFEERWKDERTEFLRALIQLANALNQLRLGLIMGPQRNLASAATLLATYEPTHAGFDVAALRTYIAEVNACISAYVADGAERIPWEAVPRLQLTLKNGDQ